MIQQVHEENWMITGKMYVIWKQAGRQNGEMESQYPQLCSAACLYAFLSGGWKCWIFWHGFYMYHRERFCRGRQRSFYVALSWWQSEDLNGTMRE